MRLQAPTMKLLLLISYCWITSTTVSAADDLYCTDLKDRWNPDWPTLKEKLVIGENSFGPALGSTIDVHEGVTLKGKYASRRTAQNVALHTLTHSHIPPNKWDTMTRWYQQDGNTQIFRLFKGEDNVRNDRVNAPRSEVYGLYSWKRGDDGWHEWSGRYTFVKVRKGAIFQIKHNPTYWSMQLILQYRKWNDTFDMYYVKLHDNNAKTLLVENVEGKAVDVRVLDDGTHHKVYVHGKLMVENSMADRLDNETNRFRWGMYSAGSPMDRDILILVTGAYVGPALKYKNDTNDQAIDDNNVNNNGIDNDNDPNDDDNDASDNTDTNDDDQEDCEEPPPDENGKDLCGVLDYLYSWLLPPNSVNKSPSWPASSTNLDGSVDAWLNQYLLVKYEAGAREQRVDKFYEEKQLWWAEFIAAVDGEPDPVVVDRWYSDPFNEDQGYI